MKLSRRSKVAWLTGLLTGLTACGGDGDDAANRADASCDACVAADAGKSDGSATDDDAASEPDAGGMDAGADMQAVTIRFKAKLGDKDLVCGQQYPGQGTTQVTATPQDFRFFVQEVRLIRKGSAQEERVLFNVEPPFQRAEVALLDFTDGKGSCQNGGSVINTTIRGRVPAGEYEGIVFVNGVPANLNNAGPAETAAAPLDDVSLFWGWLNGYRFVVAELLAVGPSHDAGDHDAAVHDAATHDAGADDASLSDAGAQDGGDPDASSAHDAGHTDAGGDDASTQGGGHAAPGAAFLHIGSSGCGGFAGSFSCTRSARNEIRLAGFRPGTSTVVADLSAVFKNSNLEEPPQCHSVAPACAAPYAVFGIDMDTGKATTTQQVFRVE